MEGTQAGIRQRTKYLAI